MWVRVGTVPPRNEGVEVLKRLDRALRALGYPKAPMRADGKTGNVYLDVGVEGAPPESVVRTTVEQVIRDTRIQLLSPPSAH